MTDIEFAIVENYAKFKGQVEAHLHMYLLQVNNAEVCMDHIRELVQSFNDEVTDEKTCHES